jgi:hypothetical protein
MSEYLFQPVVPGTRGRKKEKKMVESLIVR